MAPHPHNPAMVLASFGQGRSAQLKVWTLIGLSLAACSQSSDSSQDASDGPGPDRTIPQPDLPGTRDEAIRSVDSVFASDTAADGAVDVPIDSLPAVPIDTRTTDAREPALDGAGLDSSAVDGGTGCTKASDCTSGHCVQGVCCDRACTGVCEYCPRTTDAGTGTCVPVPAGVDPLNACKDDGPSTCGSTGACDGKGACALYAAGMQCGRASCSGSFLVTAPVCDGRGVCVLGHPASCGAYACVPELGRCDDACSEAARADGGCSASPDGSAGQ
jgi:hypothetical protein